MPFKAKTYLNGGQIHQVNNEPIIVPSADEFVYLQHDFASNVSVYTGLDSTGVVISDVTVNSDISRPWMTYLRFGSSARSTYASQTVYVNYKSEGDLVDCDMINRIEIELERHETEDPHNASSGLPTSISSVSPIDDAINVSNAPNITVSFNKWIDNSQESKLKVYSDSGRTQEVSGTVTKINEKTLQWTPTSNLSYSTAYYPRVLSGLVGIDGVASTSNYDWDFTVMQQPSNNAPVATNVAISGNSTIGSVLTGSFTYSDTESDPAGTHTYRWLRNGVAISGATATTYTIVEADIGKTLTFEVTPKATSGTLTGNPVTSSGTLIPVPAPPNPLASGGNTQATISWTDNSSFSTETYNLYWSTTTGVTKSNGTKISGVTSPYVHTSRTNGTTYYYVLTMVINGVESADSTQVSVTPNTNATPVASSVTISGTTTIGSTLTGAYTYTDAESDPQGTSTKKWYRDSQSSGATKVAISGATNTTYVIAEADVGKYLFYGVTPVATSGTLTGTETVSAGTNIPVPTVSGVSASAGNNQVTINWTNNTSFTTETYTVKRSTTSNGTYTLVTGGSGQTGNSFVDTTAVNGTQYFYKVSMTVNSVEGSDSTATSGVTPANNPYLTVPFLEDATSSLSSEWASTYVTGAGSSVTATSGKMRFNVVTVNAWDGAHKGLTKPLDLSSKKSIKFDCTKLGAGIDQWSMIISDTDLSQSANLPTNGIRMYAYNGSCTLTKYTAGVAGAGQQVWSGGTGQSTNIEVILDNSGTNTVVTVKEGVTTLLSYDMGYKLTNTVYFKLTGQKNATSSSTTIDFDNINITNA